MISLDTNVLSELMKGSEADAFVLRWFGAIETNAQVSTIALAEVRFGINRLPSGRRKDKLTRSLDVVASGVTALDFNLASSVEYGRLMARRQELGRPMAVMDGLIAATALAHGASLATRDVADFEDCGLDLIDPWMG